MREAVLRGRTDDCGEARMSNTVTKETLRMHELACDKCCGSGRVYDQRTHELIQFWRSSLGMPAKTLAALARIPYTSYCKFENGRLTFSEARLRLLIQMLTFIQDERQTAPISLCKCAVRRHNLAICPQCEKPYSADGHVFTGRSA